MMTNYKSSTLSGAEWERKQLSSSV